MQSNLLSILPADIPPAGSICMRAGLHIRLPGLLRSIEQAKTQFHLLDTSVHMGRKSPVISYAVPTTSLSDPLCRPLAFRLDARWPANVRASKLARPLAGLIAPLACRLDVRWPANVRASKLARPLAGLIAQKVYTAVYGIFCYSADTI